MRDVEPVFTGQYSAEQLALLELHFSAYVTNSIHASFVDAVRSEHPAYSAAAREAHCEAPLRLAIARDFYGAEQDGDMYFLEKYDPQSGEVRVTSDDDEILGAMVAVIGKDGTVYEKSGAFTDEQITLLFEHGQQLVEAGLSS